MKRMVVTLKPDAGLVTFRCVAFLDDWTAPSYEFDALQTEIEFVMRRWLYSHCDPRPHRVIVEERKND